MILGRHLLRVERRHGPDVVGREEDLALIPAVVVLPPGLKAVGRAVHQHEVAVPLRGVQNAGVAQGALQVVPAAVLLEDDGLQRRARRPLLETASASASMPIHVCAFARVVAADMDIPQRRLAVQLLEDPLRLG